MPWIIDSGWTRTLILFEGRENKIDASITSNPLFIKDALSIVFFVPIFQVG